eukprot:6204308-Pleurochrysis_carterae.AAC.3
MTRRHEPFIAGAGSQNQRKRANQNFVQGMQKKVTGVMQRRSVRTGAAQRGVPRVPGLAASVCACLLAFSGRSVLERELRRCAPPACGCRRRRRALLRLRGASFEKSVGVARMRAAIDRHGVSVGDSDMRRGGIGVLDTDGSGRMGRDGGIEGHGGGVVADCCTRICAGGLPLVPRASVRRRSSIWPHRKGWPCVRACEVAPAVVRQRRRRPDSSVSVPPSLQPKRFAAAATTTRSSTAPFTAAITVVRAPTATPRVIAAVAISMATYTTTVVDTASTTTTANSDRAADLRPTDAVTCLALRNSATWNVGSS